MEPEIGGIGSVVGNLLSNVNAGISANVATSVDARNGGQERGGSGEGTAEHVDEGGGLQLVIHGGRYANGNIVIVPKAGDAYSIVVSGDDCAYASANVTAR